MNGWSDLRRRAARYVLFPATQRFVRPDSLRALRALRASEQETPSARADRHDAQLRRLVRWALDTVPAYRRFYADAGISIDPSAAGFDIGALPILTKRDLRMHGSAFHSTRFGPERHWINQTSGSTGEPLNAVRDRALAPTGQASWWHALEWFGVHPGDPIVDVAGYYRQWKGVRGQEILRAWSGSRSIAKKWIDEPNPAALTAGLAGVRPRLLSGQPDQLARLAKLVLAGDVRLHAPPAAISYHGAVMTDDMRAGVARAFDAPIFSRYASMEFVPALAYTCAHGWFHVNAAHFIVEILSGAPGDRSGAAAATGRVVVTDLTNFVAPMIRYQVGDLAEVGPTEPCPCGRTWPRLARVIGRDADVVRAPSGREIAVSALARRMATALPNLPDLVWEYQLHQRALDGVEVHVVPRPAYTDEDGQRLADSLTAFFDGEVQFAATPVARIPFDGAGKRPLLVRADFVT